MTPEEADGQTAYVHQLTSAARGLILWRRLPQETLLSALTLALELRGCLGSQTWKTALGFAYEEVRRVLSGSVTLVFQVCGFCGVYMNYALVLGMHAVGFWRLPNAQDGQSPGPCVSTVCLFIGRKVTMDFISLTFRFVIKCQTLVRIVQTSHHFVRVAFLNLEIVQLSHCLALPACSLPRGYAHCGRALPPAALQGLSAPFLTAEACPGSRGLAWNPGCSSGLACLVLPALP